MFLIFLFTLLAVDVSACRAAEPVLSRTAPGDARLTNYFKTQAAKISAASMCDISSLADWQARRPELRRQAAEMLGLEPMPPRTPLNAVVTGRLERDDFTVEKVYFQSEPHLYVTANLYLPKPLTHPVPAILYLCGHLSAISNGISYGNKTVYQHHGIWFARNGFACLVVDTLQWGEIPGHHHGTYDEGMWWWNSRGYTPAGVETWNAIRALDYLQSRPEIDPERLGITGRSGGGAYSWFVGALDDRAKVIAPIAGMTDVQNYVVNGAVDDHCDCMFLVNTYRWDYPQLAALCAPRPLLLGNSDADPLFPLDGVLRTHDAMKRIYALYGCATNFGLTIDPGPHKDTQELQVSAFRWFNQHLKNQDPVITMAATKMFSPGELKVFDKIPGDQINTTIQESFVPEAQTPEVPTTPADWARLKQMWMRGLREKCFAAWPTNTAPPALHRLSAWNAGKISGEAWEFQSEPEITLQLVLEFQTGKAPRRIVLRLADENSTNDLNGPPPENTAQAVFFSRATGPEAGQGGVKSRTGLRRRFMVLGETLEGMRVWDILCAVRAVNAIPKYSNVPIELEAEGDLAVNAIYAALFESRIRSLNLHHVPASHRQGPDYLNVLKILDVPEATSMAAEHCKINLETVNSAGWDFLRAMKTSPAAHLQPVVIK